MAEVKHIHFVLDRFELGSPAQQILDRFLMGYTRDGVFQTPAWRRMAAQTETAPNDLLKRRIASHGLQLSDDVSDADAIVAINQGNLLKILPGVRDGATIFVYGALAPTWRGANDLLVHCAHRRMPIVSGTEMATALRLPEIKVTSPTEALIVVQGSWPTAELFALNGLFSFFQKPSGVRHARYLEGASVWSAGEKNEWSWPLLRAALSRTNTPQGSALIDGRVEDMAGLGLVPKLAKNPRGWLLKHENSMRTTILALDGVVADTLIAFKAGGRVVSTQLFRAPAPMHEEFGRLVSVIDDFFHSQRPPWDTSGCALVAAALEHFGQADSRTGDWI
jgi:hypothetical protein